MVANDLLGGLIQSHRREDEVFFVDRDVGSVIDRECRVFSKKPSFLTVEVPSSALVTWVGDQPLVGGEAMGGSGSSQHAVARLVLLDGFEEQKIGGFSDGGDTEAMQSDGFSDGLQIVVCETGGDKNEPGSPTPLCYSTNSHIFGLGAEKGGGVTGICVDFL